MQNPGCGIELLLLFGSLMRRVWDKQFWCESHEDDAYILQVSRVFEEIRIDLCNFAILDL